MHPKHSMRSNGVVPYCLWLICLIWLTGSMLVARGCAHQERHVMSGGAAGEDGYYGSPTLPTLLTSERILSDPVWRGDVERSKAMVKEQRWRPASMLVGAGGRHNTWTPEHGKTIWWREAQRLGAPVNSHVIWANREFEEYWFGREELVEMWSGGITPVLVLYYFGDDISAEFVTEHYTRYRSWLQKILSHLSGNGQVLVVLEPEFNNLAPKGKHHAKDWEPFGTLMIRAAAEVRHYLPNAIVGLCPGDYRSTGLDAILNHVSPSLDFLAYQELWGSTRTNNLGEDYEDITDHALEFTRYLAGFSQKRILLAYLGVSTYGRGSGAGAKAETGGKTEGSSIKKGGQEQDWRIVQANVINRMGDRLDEFVEAGLFGVLLFALYDNPAHVGYFGPAESHWGLLTVDGQPKYGMTSFVELAKRVEQLNKADSKKAATNR